MPSSNGDLATRPGAGRSGVVASPHSKMFAGRGVGDGGMMHGTRRLHIGSKLSDWRVISQSRNNRGRSRMAAM